MAIHQKLSSAGGTLADTWDTWAARIACLSRLSEGVPQAGDRSHRAFPVGTGTKRDRLSHLSRRLMLNTTLADEAGRFFAAFCDSAIGTHAQIWLNS